MTEQILEKLDNLFNNLDKCDEVIKMKQLKQEIESNEELKCLLEKYHNTDNKYSKEYVELKKQIIENPSINEYRSLENELYFTVLEMNKKLNKLVDKKRCQSESN